MIVAGNELYEQCGYCGKMCRISAWHGGVHICVSPEERARINAGYLDAFQRQQEAYRPENWLGYGRKPNE